MSPLIFEKCVEDILQYIVSTMIIRSKPGKHRVSLFYYEFVELRNKTFELPDLQQQIRLDVFHDFLCLTNNSESGTRVILTLKNPRTRITLYVE